jgi:hypothetical protein
MEAAGSISFDSSSTSPFVAYALDLVRQFCGVRFCTVDGSDPNPDIYYGNEQGRPCRLRIPCVDHYTVDDVPRVPFPDAMHGISPAEPFPFDFFAAVRFWLLDEGNAQKAETDFDEHQRLLWNRSAQEATRLRETPAVNAHLLLLRDWIEQRLQVKTARLLPSTKRCIVVLSHDVDRPFDPARLFSALPQTTAALFRGKHRGRALRYGAHSTAQAIAASLRRPRPRRWIFHDVADAEERLGFRSTFFLSATSRLADEGHALDVAYDVSTTPFRTVCRELRERGFEIGLHIGYGVGDNVERLRQERSKLEDVVGAEVIGGRHHYWHTGYPFWPALAAHAGAGLRYDSSIAFNDVPGFRLGVALPYRPWDPQTERTIAAVQIPPMAMDHAFFYRGDERVSDIVARVEQLVAELKQWEGVAALDWHQETSLPTWPPKRAFGEAYLAVLDLLAADSEIAVLTFPEVLSASSAMYDGGVLHETPSPVMRTASARAPSDDNSAE